MTITELQIQFDLNPDNQVSVLKNADTCRQINIGYLFVDQENGQCYLFDKNGNIDDINKIKIIEDYAFADCKSLTSIKIPANVEFIGVSAFDNCSSLISITISSSVKNIGRWAFANCASLMNIKIPSSVESIKHGAFINCKSLTNIEIPDSVESIGTCAFTYCISLKEVVFEGKTIDQVKAMKWYPWEIEDKSVIKVES